MFTTLLTTAVLALCPPTLDAPLPDPVTAPCYEDQLCWNPATMGNGLGSLPR